MLMFQLPRIFLLPYEIGLMGAEVLLDMAWCVPRNIIPACESGRDLEASEKENRTWQYWLNGCSDIMVSLGFVKHAIG